ncbi:MAG: aminotransferase class I/II-fold pyridoxal phosphate-dependent enzyme, partial [Pseudomonadota bacterium]
PTGIDLSTEEWTALGTFCVERKLIPLIDIAYHGFANSLDEDLMGIQRFLSNVPDAILSYSCSKNFGLYRERSGAAIVQTASETAIEAVHTHLADIARTSYSMPPAHGPAIVATIMGDEVLKKMWRDELEAMAARVRDLRASLATHLSPRSNSYDPQSLNAQNGMFSQLPFVSGGIDALRERGVYIPGSGRINIAGLRQDEVAHAASILSEFL